MHKICQTFLLAKELLNYEYVNLLEKNSDLFFKVKNGVCDSGTNIPQCVFDGGDCLGWHFVGPYLLEVLSGLHTFPEAKVGIIWLCLWRGCVAT